METFALYCQGCGKLQAGKPRIHLKFEVARQASNSSLCFSMRAVACRDEAEQQLSRLATSGCELSGDSHIVREELLEARTREPLGYV